MSNISREPKRVRYILWRRTRTSRPIRRQSGLNESDYNNNTNSLDYTPPSIVRYYLWDTTVFRKAPFNLYYNVPEFYACIYAFGRERVITIHSIVLPAPRRWLLCSTSEYGEPASDQSVRLRITWTNVRAYLPPIWPLVLSAECYDNAHIQVTFKVCIGNGYDTVYKQIPVSRFTMGHRIMQQPNYYHPIILPQHPYLANAGNIHAITAPGTSQVVAVVNGPTTQPFKETNYTNNQSSLTYDAFTIDPEPQIITLSRPGSVPLRTTVREAPRLPMYGHRHRDFPAIPARSRVATASSSEVPGNYNQLLLLQGHGHYLHSDFL